MDAELRRFVRACRLVGPRLARRALALAAAIEAEASAPAPAPAEDAQAPFILPAPIMRRKATRAE